MRAITKFAEMMLRENGFIVKAHSLVEQERRRWPSPNTFSQLEHYLSRLTDSELRILCKMDREAMQFIDRSGAPPQIHAIARCLLDRVSI